MVYVRFVVFSLMVFKITRDGCERSFHEAAHCERPLESNGNLKSTMHRVISKGWG
jgi:hypothetical protein